MELGFPCCRRTKEQSLLPTSIMKPCLAEERTSRQFMLWSYSQFYSSLSNSSHQRESWCCNWYCWYIPMDFCNCPQTQGLHKPTCEQISSFCAAKGDGKTEWEATHSCKKVIGLMLNAGLVACSRLSLGCSLGPADALMPFLPYNTHIWSPKPNSQRPMEGNGHSHVKSSLGWWLCPPDSRSALSDKWLELHCCATCKYA